MFAFNGVNRVVALLVIGGLVAWFWWLHPKVIAAKQTRNWGIVQSYVAVVEAYRAEHGTFPATLGEAIPVAAEHRERWLAALDAYDRPLHYSSDGAQFLIASYGQDGVPGPVPTGLDDPEITSIDPACKDANIDTTYSSIGRVRRCGK